MQDEKDASMNIYNVDGGGKSGVQLTSANMETLRRMS